MFSFVNELKQISRLKGVSRREIADKIAEVRMPPVLTFVSKHAPFVAISLIWSVPFLVSGLFFKWMEKNILQLQYGFLALALLPLIFILSFLFTAGGIASLVKKGIVSGKFPRLASHPLYAIRRVYGAAWTQVFYFKPLYAVCLAVPFLKKIMFRLFGLRGDLSFIVYPDAWIRDLPLLEIGKDVYIANRASVGTNLCLIDGSTIVGPITFADNSLVGHMAVLGLGGKLGKSTELGVSTCLGLRISIGDNVVIGPRVNINHAAEIGDNAHVDGAALIGLKAKIGPGVKIRVGAHIPEGSVVMSQEDADRIMNNEDKNLRNLHELYSVKLRDGLNGFETQQT